MIVCPHCHYELEPGRPLPDTCPQCASTLEEKTPFSEEGKYDSWVSIARLTSLAEVGFFADILSAHHIPSHVRNREEFSAVDGSWRANYFLQVPPDLVEQATELMKQELAQSENEPFYLEHEIQESEEIEPSKSITIWKPMMAVLAVAGLVYYFGQKMDIQKAGIFDSRPALWEVLSEMDHPLESEAVPGIPRRRLKYFPHSQTILIEDDHDGDGQFEERRLFRKGRLVDKLSR